MACRFSQRVSSARCQLSTASSPPIQNQLRSNRRLRSSSRVTCTKSESLNTTFSTNPRDCWGSGRFRRLSPMFVQRIAEGHLLVLIRHAECTLHQLHLAGLQLDDALLNRVLHDKSSHRHASLLADTVDPVYSLLLTAGFHLPQYCSPSLDLVTVRTNKASMAAHRHATPSAYR